MSWSQHRAQLRIHEPQSIDRNRVQLVTSRLRYIHPSEKHFSEKRESTFLGYNVLSSNTEHKHRMQQRKDPLSPAFYKSILFLSYPAISYLFYPFYYYSTIKAELLAPCCTGTTGTPSTPQSPSLTYLWQRSTAEYGSCTKTTHPF